MPPLIGDLLQLGFILLLYLFVYRAVRAVVRDLRSAGPPARPPTAPPAQDDPAPAAGRGQRARRGTPGQLVVHHPEGRPRVVKLDGGELVLGRSADATVQLGDAFASDEHARVFPSDGQWMVDDLGSTNGTYLNQVKVTQPTPIAAGDQLGIGKTRVEVRK